MPRPARRFVTLFTLVSFLSSQAWAGSLPMLAVPPLGESPDQRASDAIARAFAATGKVSVIDRASVDRQIQGRKKSSPAKAAKDHAASDDLKKGQEALRKLKFKEAVESLNKAKLSYRKQLSDDESFQGLRAAQFNLALAYLSMKDETRAREELKEFIRTDPERGTRKLSEKQYPPSIRNLHRKVRDEMSRQKSGELLVSTTPPKAMVYVDGKAAGAAPLSVRSLPPGEHFVRVSAEGLEPHFAPTFIVAGENRLELELKPLFVLDPYRTFGTVEKASDIDHRRAAFLDEVGLALGADIWVFLTPGNAEVSGQLYDQRSQEISAVVKDSDPNGLVTKLAHFIDSGGYVYRSAEPEKIAAPVAAAKLPPNLAPDEEGTFSKEAGRPAESAPRASRGVAWYQNPWVWAAVGGAVLLAGAGIYLFTDLGKKDATTSTLKVNIP